MERIQPARRSGYCSVLGLLPGHHRDLLATPTTVDEVFARMCYNEFFNSSLCESRGFREDRSSGFQRTRTKANLFVQDNTEEGIVDLNLAIVLDEAQFPKFVHKEIDPGTCCSNHLRQHLLRYFGERFV